MAMSRTEIKEKLADVMQMAMLGSTVDPATLSESSNLVTDVGLSSVGILYVVIAIEEFFNIRNDTMGIGTCRSKIAQF